MQHLLLIISFLAIACRSDASNLRGQPSQRDFRMGTGGYAAIRAQAQQRTSPQARANQPPSVKVTRSLKKAGESREETGMKTLYARPTVRVPQGSLTPSAPSFPKVIPPSVKDLSASLPKVVSPLVKDLSPTATFFPTVDVFFFLDFVGGQKYVRKEYFWMLPKVAAMHARANANGTESDTRIHVVSSSIDVLERASQLGFYSHDLNYQMKQYSSLLSRIAATVRNDRQERKVLRWKAFHDIVSEWNTDAPESPIQRVMVMEDDVLLTVNAAALFDRTLKAAAPSTELVSLANGVNVLSVSGLASFSTFIDEWYSGSTEDIEARSMDAENREWTDTLLVKRFITAPASSTAPSTSPAPAPRLAWFAPSETKLPSAEQERLSKVLGCVPQESYKVNSNVHFEVDGLVLSGSAPSRITNTTQISVKSAQEKQPYCFLHFQERNHKTLLYAYGRSLEILRQGEEKYSVSARDNLAGDLLLQPENSQEIYHISSDAVMKFIPSQELFNSRSFTADDIISNVPMAIITAFKPSPGPAHPFKDGQTVQFVGRSRTVYLVKEGILHPIANGQVFERLNLKFEDVIKDKTYNGPVFNTLPFGIELQ